VDRGYQQQGGQGNGENELQRVYEGGTRVRDGRRRVLHSLSIEESNDDLAQLVSSLKSRH
jgi:hypothetical protein